MLSCDQTCLYMETLINFNANRVYVGFLKINHIYGDLVPIMYIKKKKIKVNIKTSHLSPVVYNILILDNNVNYANSYGISTLGPMIYHMIGKLTGT